MNWRGIHDRKRLENPDRRRRRHRRLQPAAAAAAHGLPHHGPGRIRQGRPGPGVARAARPGAHGHPHQGRDGRHRTSLGAQPRLRPAHHLPHRLLRRHHPGARAAHAAVWVPHQAVFRARAARHGADGAGAPRGAGSAERQPGQAAAVAGSGAARERAVGRTRGRAHRRVAPARARAGGLQPHRCARPALAHPRHIGAEPDPDRNPWRCTWRRRAPDAAAHGPCGAPHGRADRRLAEPVQALARAAVAGRRGPGCAGARGGTRAAGGRTRARHAHRHRRRPARSGRPGPDPQRHRQPDAQRVEVHARTPPGPHRSGPTEPQWTRGVLRARQRLRL